MSEGHEPALIATITLGLTLAFVFGLAARRLRLPAIVGYLLAGILIGPFTPGYVADGDLAAQLAEIGVILLMFSVGLHFSVRDLMAVRSVAIPGAVGQITVASILGTLLGLAFGWSIGGAIVLGLAISVASTVVLVRALMERGELDSAQGRIAVGWLIVEDLFTVLVLVLLPTIAPLLGGTGDPVTSPEAAFLDVGFALLKAGAFAALMLIIGARLMPRLLASVATLHDREIFILAAVAVALGIAYLAYALFGLSLALGAFLAGAVVSESDTSHQVAADALPLREIFAVLFFVSVGMLVDPAYLAANIPAIVAVVLVVIVAKSIAAFTIVLGLGYLPRVGLTVAAGLAQIGEFSFILGTLGLQLGLLPPEGIQLLVSAALISIALNPVAFRLVDPMTVRLGRSPLVTRIVGSRAGDLSAFEPKGDGPRGHAVVVGSGRVGRLVMAALDRRGFRYTVISEDRRDIQRLRVEGVRAYFGDATNQELLARAGVADARILVVAIPDVHATEVIVARARLLAPRIALVVRTHSERQMAELSRLEGSVQAVHGELELAVQMTRYTLRRFGVSSYEAEAIAQGLRSRGGRPWPLDVGRS
jgi:CPA2 family monovalent cation:H+ antiporter-2